MSAYSVEGAVDTAMAGPPGPEAAAPPAAPGGPSPSVQAFVEAISQLPPEQQEAIMAQIMEMLQGAGAAPAGPEVPPAAPPAGAPPMM